MARKLEYANKKKVQQRWKGRTKLLFLVLGLNNVWRKSNGLRWREKNWIRTTSPLRWTKDFILLMTAMNVYLLRWKNPQEGCLWFDCGLRSSNQWTSGKNLKVQAESILYTLTKGNIFGPSSLGSSQHSTLRKKKSLNDKKRLYNNEQTILFTSLLITSLLSISNFIDLFN